MNPILNIKINPDLKTEPPLFGTPSSVSPENPFGFKIKNNRIQYPDIFFDIDTLDFDNLPPEIEYFGQFPLYRNYENWLIVFRYKTELLFHKRTNIHDSQMRFPWSTLNWLIEIFDIIVSHNQGGVNLASQKRIINGHHLELIHIAGDTLGKEGFWLRDHDTIDPACVAMGCRNIRDVTTELYLSEFGLFENNGLVILKKAMNGFI